MNSRTILQQNIVLFLIDLQGTNGLPGDKGEVGVTGSPVSSFVMCNFMKEIFREESDIL